MMMNVRNNGQWNLLGTLLVLLAAATGRAQAPMEIVSYSNVYAAIVVADQPDGGAIEAAGLLQRYIGRITGQELAIQTISEYEADRWQARIAICVGRSAYTDAMGIDVPQEVEGDDRYVLRTDVKANRIAIVGNDGGDRRGSVFGVYDILQRYGCGWYGPDDLWQVIPRLRQFSIAHVDVDERAAFRGRYIWMANAASPVLRDAWRLGGRGVNPGHALGWVVPREKYLAEHPEYFGPIQPCLTNPQVIGIAAEFVAGRIGAAKGWKHYESLTAIDEGGFCNCADCQAVGNISARMLNFANRIAERLDGDEANRGQYELWFLAYWHTHEPPKPMIKAHPAVKVMMVNEGNHAKPLDAPEEGAVANASRNNTREVRDMAGWQETGALAGVYEWWIPNIVGSGDPRPWQVAPWISGETGLSNQRYWRERGVKYLSYETKFEIGGTGFPRRWALWYIGAQGMWNPDRKSADLLREPCRRLFGDDAGPIMLEYYLSLEKALAETEGYGGNWALPAVHVVYTAEVEAKAAELLAKAAAVVDTPERKARVAHEQSVWAHTRQIIATQRGEETRSYIAVLDGKTMPWTSPSIDEATLRSLFGINTGVPFYAVEAADGQTRAVNEDEVFDLTTGITFTLTVK